jgi:hypothetical protein
MSTVKVVMVRCDRCWLTHRPDQASHTVMMARKAAGKDGWTRGGLVAHRTTTGDLCPNCSLAERKQ